MVRVKIRYEFDTTKKLFRFDPNKKEEYESFKRKIATKLGVINQLDKQQQQQTFQLYLGDGEVLVEDISEIDEGDDLVLKNFNKNNKNNTEISNPGSNDSGSSNSEKGSSDSGGNGKKNSNIDSKITSVQDTKISKDSGKDVASAILDQHNDYVGLRIAKYFFIGDENDDNRELFFGRVASFSPKSRENNNVDVWTIHFDDGDSQDFDLEELKACIQLAKDNTHLHKHKNREDGDDSTDIEDITEEILSSKNKKKQNTVAIDISTDDDDDEIDKDLSDDDTDNDDDSEFLSDDFEDDHEVKPRSKKRVRQIPLPPLQVLMDKKDIPAAPGKPYYDKDDDDPERMQEASTLYGTNNADQAVKERIMKLLNTGFHELSNENEAKNAMKLAQRLMRKHNLSQALLLQEHKDRNENNKSGEEEVILKGGMVSVRIVYRKTQSPSQLARWISDLTYPVCKNFDVNCFWEVQRGYRCTVTFYGIYTNCQLAAYAFRVAVERISQMMVEYKPTSQNNNNNNNNNNDRLFYMKKKSISTKSSKLSYALGIVRGIEKEVNTVMEQEKQKLVRKLERARQAASKGEAYEESDDDDDDDDVGYSFPTNKYAKNGEKSKAGDNETNSGDEGNSNEEDDDDEYCKKPPAVMSSVVGTATQSHKNTTVLKGAALDQRVNELENEKKTAIVLVNHREKVEKDVLKKAGIKLSKSTKRKPITFDWQSYEKGIEDSKEIDINQRAIRDEVKIKKEKKM